MPGTRTIRIAECTAVRGSSLCRPPGLCLRIIHPRLPVLWPRLRSLSFHYYQDPRADPLIGIIIAGAVIYIVSSSMKEVTYVRARWLGHQLHVEINLTVSDDISVKAGHEIAKDDPRQLMQRQLMHCLDHLSGATIHVDPLGISGEEHHRS